MTSARIYEGRHLRAGAVGLRRAQLMATERSLRAPVPGAPAQMVIIEIESGAAAAAKQKRDTPAARAFTFLTWILPDSRKEQPGTMKLL